MLTDLSVCPKGTSYPAAHEEPRPKGPVNLPQVSQLTKSLVPTKLPAMLSHRRSTTVSLETYPFIQITSALYYKQDLTQLKISCN